MGASDATPRLRVEQACEAFGRAEIVRRCLRLLAGDGGDPRFVAMLGGAPALHLLASENSHAQDYWVRVWAARGLLWAGPGEDTAILRAALNDDSWRVREMVCKVVARHRVGDLLDDVARLEADPVLRVGRAAHRAATRIVDADA